MVAGEGGGGEGGGGGGRMVEGPSDDGIVAALDKKSLAYPPPCLPVWRLPALSPCGGSGLTPTLDTQHAQASVNRPRGRYHGGLRPSSDDSLHSPTVIPPSALATNRESRSVTIVGERRSEV